MIRVGKVVKRQGETVQVKVPRVGGTCETCICEAGGGDTSCQSDNSFFVTAADPVGVAVGSRVEVEIRRSKILSTVLVVFWVPILLAGLAGYGAWRGAALWLGTESDLIAGLGSLTGLALGIVLAVWTERRTVGSRRGVTVTRLLSPPPERAGSQPTSGGSD